jgi:hypothetical protein
MRSSVTDTDARLWHPWLRIHRVLRVMLHTRWSGEAWLVVRVELRRAPHDAQPESVRHSQQVELKPHNTVRGTFLVEGRLDHRVRVVMPARRAH